MYGTQTCRIARMSLAVFENDVKMYGTQTREIGYTVDVEFENDVKMYGTQTLARCNLVLEYK